MKKYSSFNEHSFIVDPSFMGKTEMLGYIFSTPNGVMTEGLKWRK